MQSLIDSIESKYKKKQVVDVRSGDTVRVHQKITEGDKTRVQVFEGVVIKTAKKNSHSSRIWVRRIASGVGVEKSFLMHSPLVEKVEVIKRSKVRRNNLSYMRTRAGKAARLVGMDFDVDAVNTIEEQQDEAEVVPGEPETKGAKATEEINEAEEESKESKEDSNKAEQGGDEAKFKVDDESNAEEKSKDAKPKDSDESEDKK